MSWIRVDADYLDDARIWDAGWEAALVWVPVLALLKANSGILDDATLSGRYVARKVGCPVELAASGIDALKRVGLLVQGRATWKAHKGTVVVRDGWLTPNWAAKGNAPRSWVADGSPVGPKVAEPCGTLPNLAEGKPTVAEDSRARCRVASRPVGSDRSVDARDASTEWRTVGAPEPRTELEDQAADLWRRLIGPSEAHRIPATYRPPASDLAELARIIERNTPAVLDEAVKTARRGERPRALFAALWDADGKRKQKPRRRGEPKPYRSDPSKYATVEELLAMRDERLAKEETT